MVGNSSRVPAPGRPLHAPCTPMSASTYTSPARAVDPERPKLQPCGHCVAQKAVVASSHAETVGCSAPIPLPASTCTKLMGC